MSRGTKGLIIESQIHEGLTAIAQEYVETSKWSNGRDVERWASVIFRAVVNDRPKHSARTSAVRFKHLKVFRTISER